jgi:hypothetical protein
VAHIVCDQQDGQESEVGMSVRKEVVKGCGEKCKNWYSAKIMFPSLFLFH